MKRPESAPKDLDTDRLGTRIGKAFQRSRALSLPIALALVMIVGVADYFSGYQIYWSIFYLVAVSFALWNVGALFAVFISALSIISWLVGDWAAGVVYPNRFVVVWNALITFGSYLVVIWLLSRLKSSHQLLETRIQDRTAALQREIGARQQLEKDVAEVTERERLRIGHELHDTLSQHLAATSLSLQVLSGKLSQDSLPQAADADQAVHLIEDAIDLTRKLAKGLFPLELEGEGLNGALVELCRSAADRHRIKCEFKSESHVQSINSSTATHLYRIAQEAVANAVKHGHVSQVVVDFSAKDGNLVLSVSDDGIGFPEELPADRGLGLRIMASRAGMIGADFFTKNNSVGGVTVKCQLPLPIEEHSNSERDVRV
jgi:signal transduction histidine kinase